MKGVKANLKQKKIENILSEYDMGHYLDSRILSDKSVQTNILLETDKGKYILKYYCNRTKPYVLFEANLLHYLHSEQFPCPKIILNRKQESVDIYNQFPFLVFEYISGIHLKDLDMDQRGDVIKTIARLHQITNAFIDPHISARLNYSVDFCHLQATQVSKNLNTRNAIQKLSWFNQQLEEIVLPSNLPKGICHGDLHPTNLIFEYGNLKSIIDFDDANFTYYLWDIVNFIDYYTDKNGFGLNFEIARQIIRHYEDVRTLNEVEKEHIFDVYLLHILIDCIWYFERGDYKDFFERRRINYFKDMGREEFKRKLFG